MLRHQSVCARTIGPDCPTIKPDSQPTERDSPSIAADSPRTGTDSPRTRANGPRIRPHCPAIAPDPPTTEANRTTTAPDCLPIAPDPPRKPPTGESIAPNPPPPAPDADSNLDFAEKTIPAVIRLSEVLRRLRGFGWASGVHWERRYSILPASGFAVVAEESIYLHSQITIFVRRNFGIFPKFTVPICKKASATFEREDGVGGNPRHFVRIRELRRRGLAAGSIRG